MKIIIFYGSYGGGHISAAKTINEYIMENYPEHEVLFVDAIECVNRALNKITTKAYENMSKRAPWAWKQLYYKSEKSPFKQITNETHKVMAVKLNKLLRQYKPDLIISTHPFSSHMCAYLKKKGKITCKIATILTDFAPHEQWLVYSEFVDYYFVAHAGMIDSLNAYGVDKEKIYPFGIPLSNRFLQPFDRNQILHEFNLEDNKTTILFFAGGKYGLGKESTYTILKTLAKDFTNIQIIAIAGTNKKMQNNFELIAQEFPNSTIRVLPFTPKVPELMSISDLVITKPGGLTTTESLASGLPILIINPIPGQEEENTEFLESNGVGIWIKNDDNISQKLHEILNSSSLLENMKKNTELFAKKNSTKNICEKLLKNI